VINMLKELAGRIRNEGGFEMYFWAGDLEGVNDVGGANDYTRATHNLRRAPESYLSCIFLSGAPGGFSANMRGFEPVVYGKLKRDTKMPVTRKRPQWVTESVTEYKTEWAVEDVPEEKAVSRKGPLGWLGFTKTITVNVPTDVQKSVPVTREKNVQKEVLSTKDEWVYRTPPLSEVINTDYRGDTYFVTLFLEVPNLCCRGEDSPSMTIVGSEALVGDVVSYLRSNPSDYHRLAQELFPEEKFPNVNGKIIQHAQPAPSVLFVDYDSLPEEVKGSRNGKIDWDFLSEREPDSLGEMAQKA
jgi:hypothetical protein